MRRGLVWVVREEITVDIRRFLALRVCVCVCREFICVCVLFDPEFCLKLELCVSSACVSVLPHVLRGNES